MVPDPQITPAMLATACRVLHQHGIVPTTNHPSTTSAATADWQLDPVSGGTSGRTFHLRDAEGTSHWTLRFARPGGADRLAWEGAVLQGLHAAMLAPPAAPPRIDEPDLAEALAQLQTTAPTPPPSPTWLPADPLLLEDPQLPDGCLLLHRHMPGTPRELPTLPDTALAHLGTCLGWLHDQPRAGYAIWPAYSEQPGTRADALRARIASLDVWAGAVSSDDASQAMLAQLRALPLDPQAGWQETTFSLLHGDLSPGNILWHGNGGDGAVGLIDWEYARAGDPAEELAYLISEASLPPERFAVLADAWLAQHDDPWAMARLPVWLPFVAVDSALWWRAYARTHPHLDVRTQVAARFTIAQRVLAGGQP